MKGSVMIVASCLTTSVCHDRGLLPHNECVLTICARVDPAMPIVTSWEISFFLLDSSVEVDLS